jgi:hypothetical protein
MPGVCLKYDYRSYGVLEDQVYSVPKVEA